MRTFREIAESEDKGLVKAIKAIMKNKHFAKNVAVFDRTLYFEFKDTNGAMRISKKVTDDALYEGEIKSIGAGVVGFYQSYIAAILDNKETSAYLEIVFNNDVPSDIISLSKAVKVSNSDYQKRLKEING